jgi:hypothetical protein
MGFGRSAIANVRSQSQRIGDHCARARIIRQIGWLNRVSPSNSILSFIIIVSVFHRALAAGFARWSGCFL